MKITELLNISEGKMKDLAYAISHGAENPLVKKTLAPVSRHMTLINNLAKQSGTDPQKVLTIWNNARQRYGQNWAQVTAQTKRELGI